MKSFFTLSVMFLAVLIAGSKEAASQQAPLYKFTSYTLDSGTANTTGAVYRFANVFAGVDAFIKVTGMSSGISLRDIDRTADGYLEAFQPEYRISGNTNGYIDFKITYVIAGTNTIVSQPAVAASGLDIDGSSSGASLLKEFNRIDMGGGVYEYNSYNSQIIISQTGTAFTATNATGILFGALVDTAAKEVMYTVASNNVSSMTYRVGANNQTSNSSTRYASLYFQKFTYQHFPVAISSLLSFDGSENNNKISLQWDMITDKANKVILERSYSSTDFSKVAEYDINIDGSRKTFRYTDNSVTGSVVFYRLKSIGVTGHIEYSNILSFRLSAETKKDLHVYPSVIQTYTTVSIDVAEKTNAVLLVTDFAGRTVKQQQITLNAGSNNITVNGFERFLKGNYVVSVRTNSGLFTKQVVIQ